MSADIIRGADFRAKSIDALTIEHPAVMEAADIPCLKSDGVAGGLNEAAEKLGSLASCGNPVAGSSPACGTMRNLPYCDIRVLQDAERHTARFAESIAVLADRAGDAGLKRYLALIAESHVEEAKLLREMTVAGLAAKGGAA